MDGSNPCESPTLLLQYLLILSSFKAISICFKPIASIMITAKCHIVDCTLITLGGSGWCFSCDSNLCPTHKAAESHACDGLTASSITVKPRRRSILIEMQDDERDTAASARYKSYVSLRSSLRESATESLMRAARASLSTRQVKQPI
jgi:hypothetical protein